MVKHRRYTPFKREFSYPIFMLYLDINDLDSVMKKSLFWNVDKPAVVSFNRKDFHNVETKSLDKAIRDTVEQKIGSRPIGKIRMLAHLRYFGYCFNPVSFYYCFDKDDNKVEFILAEVTNTPWKERFSYVLRASNNKQENKIILENVLFITGYSYLTRLSKKTLDDVAETLKKETFSFVIQGHVCCTEGALDAVDRKTNKRNLSIARAKYVYDYLLEKGIKKSRMSYEGMAHKYPLGGSEDKDRRVEILILSD